MCLKICDKRPEGSYVIGIEIPLEIWYLEQLFRNAIIIFDSGYILCVALLPRHDLSKIFNGLKLFDIPTFIFTVRLINRKQLGYPIISC